MPWLLHSIQRPGARLLAGVWLLLLLLLLLLILLLLLLLLLLDGKAPC